MGKSKEIKSTAMSNMNAHDRKLLAKISKRNHSKGRYFVKHLVLTTSNTRSETQPFQIISEARKFALKCNTNKTLISFKNQNGTLVTL